MPTGGKKKSAKKSAKKSGKKRKPSPYINFMKKFFQQHKGEDVKEVMKKGAKEWKKLSDAEKAKFK